MKNFAVLLVVFLSWVSIANASVSINEFVSHPNEGEKEWVELINTDGIPKSLKGWKLTELSSPGTIPVEKDLLLLSGTIDDVLFFDVGTTKLNDGGDSIGLYNGDTLISRITYGTDTNVKNYFIDLTAPSIGKSGALVSGSWLTNQNPTKGSFNSESDSGSSDSSSEEDTDDTSSSTSNSSSKIDKPEVFKITTKIISPKIVVAGIPFLINSLTTTNWDKTYSVGKFIWNFGDGMKIENTESIPFDYTYEYPGEYILTLSYFDNSFNKIADATDRIIVKVIASDVYISSVGTDSDPYIELENKSKYEVILSGWIINAGAKSFVFPEGTTLLQGKKIKLSPKITGFNSDDIKYITITNPNKELIATYPVGRIKLIQNIVSVSKVSSNNKKDNSQIEDSQIINLNDLGASASDSKINISSGVYSLIGLIVIIGLGIASFLFIKKKKEIPDYVEKGIRAEDMTIIE